MTPELESYYAACLDTVRSPGWALILEDFDRLRRQVADVRGCTNLDLAKGQLDVLDMLAAWKDTLEKAYEQLSAEE